MATFDVIVKADGSWVPDDPGSRAACYPIYRNIKFLVKQFEGINIQPVGELDQSNWPIVLRSIGTANELNARSYMSWDAEALKVFQAVQHNLRLGLRTIKKYKPDFVYDPDGMIAA